MKDFRACFGDTNNVGTTINKFRRLSQGGDRSASTYAADFHVLASALLEQFPLWTPK
jgi:hypothetical protein